MQLFSNLQQQYDQLWRYIIRPKRSTYPQRNLGPQLFQLQGKKIKRIDFEVVNPRGHVLFGSHFIPLQQQEYPCIIYMHGNSSNRTQGIQYLGHLMRANISLCTFDFSGCGNSQGDYVSLGYYQQQDLEEVVKYIKSKRQITKIAIWGRSMGAVTALMYLRKSFHITAAVFDSPFKSLKSLIEDLCKKNSKIPTLIIQGALKIIAGTIQQKAKFDVYKLNPLKYQVPNLQFPAFFIVGKQDNLIPPQHTYELYKNYKGSRKHLQTVKGNHNDSRPQECVLKVVQFFKVNLFLEAQLKISEQQNVKIGSGHKSSTKVQQKQFDFFDDNYQNIDDDMDQIQNSSRQTQNTDFFSDQYQNKINNNNNNNININAQKQQLNQISFNLQQKSSQSSSNNITNFSFSSMFTNIFSSGNNNNNNNNLVQNNKSTGVNQKQSIKQRQIDGYEKLIQKISNELIIQNTEQIRKNKQKNKQYKAKELKQIKQHKAVNKVSFQKQILANLDTWAY